MSDTPPLYMEKLKSNEYYLILVLLIILGIFLGIFILTQWNPLGPYPTIAMSVELGVLTTMILVIIANRKKILLSKSFEKTTGRISELTESFHKISKELINIHQELESEIEANKTQLRALELQTTEISKKKEDLKKELEILEQTKPEVVEYFINQVKSGEYRGYLVNLGLFVLGIIMPNILGYSWHLIFP